MTAKKFIDLDGDLVPQLSKMAQRAIRRLMTHPALTDEKRIELLRSAVRMSGAYLKVAEMMPSSLEFNDEEWRRFVQLCQALGFDPAGLRNREE